MKFNPGDPVWVTAKVVNPGTVHAGSVVEWDFYYHGYIVDIPGTYNPIRGEGYPATCWLAEASQLRPRTDPSPKEQLGEWELCPWQPRRNAVTVSVPQDK